MASGQAIVGAARAGFGVAGRAVTCIQRRARGDAARPFGQAFAVRQYGELQRPCVLVRQRDAQAGCLLRGRAER